MSLGPSQGVAGSIRRAVHVNGFDLGMCAIIACSRIPIFERLAVTAGTTAIDEVVDGLPGLRRLSFAE